MVLLVILFSSPLTIFKLSISTNWKSSYGYSQLESVMLIRLLSVGGVVQSDRPPS